VIDSTLDVVNGRLDVVNGRLDVVNGRLDVVNDRSERGFNPPFSHPTQHTPSHPTQHTPGHSETPHTPSFRVENGRAVTMTREYSRTN
jgi:hypothetical protein